MKSLNNKQIITIIILTTLVNILIFGIIGQGPSYKEQYWIDKYQECKNKNETKIIEDKILKEVEDKLNDKFVWKTDYFKLHNLYDNLFTEYNKQGNLIMEYHNKLNKIIDLNNKLKYCNYMECKKIEYELYKLIDTII